VFQFVFVSGHYRIEHFFFCQKVLILLLVVEDCGLRWKRVSDSYQGAAGVIDVLFVDISPGEKVALLVSSALLWWHCMVFHCKSLDRELSRGSDKSRVRKMEAWDQTGIEAKVLELLINIGSPGYGHVGPKRSSFLIGILFQ
jgi:hypothetical protein